MQHLVSVHVTYAQRAQHAALGLVRTHPAYGGGVLAITKATDGILRGLYCRKWKKRQAVRLISNTPPARPGPPPIETRRIRGYEG